MKSEITSTSKFRKLADKNEVELSETETYEELAQHSVGNVSSTFEDMDTAGKVAEWMIWIGIGSIIITAILCLCSLAQIVPSRPTLLAGGISSALLFFAPIFWFLLLPSDGTYSNDSIFHESSWLVENLELFVKFEPASSTGPFLSILGGLCAVAMMVAIFLFNRAELTEEKPSWMKQNPFKNPRISGLPWVTIGVVILVLFALGGGGYFAYTMFSSDVSSDTLDEPGNWAVSFDENTSIFEESVILGDEESYKSTTRSFLKEQGMGGINIGYVEFAVDCDDTDDLTSGFTDSVEGSSDVSQVEGQFADQDGDGLCGDGDNGFKIRWDVTPNYIGADYNASNMSESELREMWTDGGWGRGTWSVTITADINSALLDSGEEYKIIWTWVTYEVGLTRV